MDVEKNRHRLLPCLVASAALALTSALAATELGLNATSPCQRRWRKRLRPLRL